LANFNKVILGGYLTTDPAVNGNENICNFGLAINEVWTSKKNGQRQQETCFIDVVAFGRQADLICQYFSKGLPILIEGKIKWREWRDSFGEQKGKHEIVVDRFTFVGEKAENGNRPAIQ
tara:strand:+ start:1180 stop:1536 length:357 start_codon:yes stop_codon:yes gene_type:complete